MSFRKLALCTVPIAALAYAYKLYNTPVRTPTIAITPMPRYADSPRPITVKWGQRHIAAIRKFQYRYCHFEAFYRNVQAEGRVPLFYLLISFSWHTGSCVMSDSDLRRAVDQVYLDIVADAPLSMGEIHAEYAAFCNA